MSPTPIRIQPTASMFTELDDALTANVRIAPTAIKKMPTPSPIRTSFVLALDSRTEQVENRSST